MEKPACFRNFGKSKVRRRRFGRKGQNTDCGSGRQQWKKLADGIIQTAREKGFKKTDAREELQNGEETGKTAKGKKQRKENEPEIRLNDVLRTAIDGYNDAYTVMNDNGVTLYRERIRAVDLILHIEDLINSIANHPKEFDTEIQEIKRSGNPLRKSVITRGKS